MNKKGFFFSIITVGLILVLIALFLTYQIRDTKTEITVDQVRVSTMAKFADDLEKELVGQAMNTPGKKALKEMENAVRTGPISNPESALRTLIIRGGGAVVGVDTFSFEIEKLHSLAGRSGIELTLTYQGGDLKDITPDQLIVTQEDPWGVKIGTQQPVNLVLNSENPKLRIERSFIPETRIDIRNLANDPLYLRNGIAQEIRSDNVVNPGDPDYPTSVEGVRAAAQNVKFIATTNGISYLNRFTPTPAPGAYGIERLILPGQEAVTTGDPDSMTDWENVYGRAGNCVVGLTKLADCGTSGNSRYRLSNPSRYGLSTCLCERQVDCEESHLCSVQSCEVFCQGNGGAQSESYILEDGLVCDAATKAKNCCVCNAGVPGG